MAIRTRDDRGGYQVYWRNPLSGKQETKFFHNKREAEKFNDQITYRLKWEPNSFYIQEQELNDNGTTFDQALDFYLKQKRLPRRYLSKLLGYMKKVSEMIGGTLLDEITTKDLVSVQMSFSGGPATVKRKMTTVKAVLSMAYKNCLSTTVPRYPETPKVVKKILVPPTYSELEAIYNVSSRHLQRAIIIGAQFGCRMGESELFDIRWSDFHFERNVLSLRASKKNVSEPVREIPIRQQIKPLLMSWMEHDTKIGVEYVINYNRKKVTKISNAWHKALERAGFSRNQFRLYDIRHAFATESIAAGADLGTVSKIMGHSNISMTANTYQHVLTRQKVEAIENMPCLNYAHGGCTENT